MKSNVRLTLFIAALLLANWGCTSSQEMHYSQSWENGMLREELPFPVTDVHRAAVSALIENEFTVLEDKSVLGSVTIKSITVGGNPIEIAITSLKEEAVGKISPDLRMVLEKETRFLSAISIHIGTTGDRDRSRRILESVHSYLH